MDALIRLGETTKRYASTAALDHVSLEVAAGEALAVMGPSGSGKSTLLNLIAGLDKPTSGTVTVAGQRVDALSETRLARYRRREVGMIFQLFNLLDDLTVAANVLLPAQLAGTPPAQGPGPVRRVAGPARHWQVPGHLPGAAVRRGAAAGGDRPRVGQQSGDPPRRRADRAVDTVTGEEIGQLLLDLNAAGQTLVLVTHSPDLAARYARRTVRLLDGHVASDTGAAGGAGDSRERPGAGPRP
jgi:putative ABC transport system ATP-binding protein